MPRSSSMAGWSGMRSGLSSSAIAKSNGHVYDIRQINDAHMADFQQSGDIGGRAGVAIVPSGGRQRRIIIAHQHGAPVDQPQGQVGLARSAGSHDEQAVPCQSRRWWRGWFLTIALNPPLSVSSADA